MNKRPTSITIISWFYIVVGLINVVTSTLTFNQPMVRELMSKSPLPIPVQIGISYLGFGILVASGIGMLKGHNWGRWLYIIWSVIGIVIGLATSPMKLMMLPGIVIFLIITFFLLRPQATAYFVGETSSDAQDT